MKNSARTESDVMAPPQPEDALPEAQRTPLRPVETSPPHKGWFVSGSRCRIEPWPAWDQIGGHFTVWIDAAGVASLIGDNAVYRLNYNRLSGAYYYHSRTLVLRLVE